MSIFFKNFGPYSKLRTANWPIAWRKQTQPYNNDIYWKGFVMCNCFRAPIKTFFFDTCQMTVKSCVLHLFPVPPVFSVRTVNHGSSFFSIDLWPKRWMDRWRKLGPWFTVRTENSANKRYLFRRGSRINNDRFPNERRRRELLAGSGGGGVLPQEIIWIFSR